ncbi:acyl-CoA thioesterase II [Vitreimonas sp.]|jgi:acyl-CoA thioesterase-2|uniref:acyl-CoA thioesterase n=1 Tax=Vitreimonas sp. TaxID=3069702 RepID=UPI002EDB38A1
MSAMDELVDILTIEPIEVNLFRGRSPAADRIRIFGGQVVAQALTAAYKTVEGRICHSLQSYFIRPGDPKQPVLYQVERSRDGKSFATRRVIAIQKGEQIFNLACSFQVPEDGYDHADEMPPAPLPNEVPDENERWREMFKDQPEQLKHWVRDRPIELRPVSPVNLLKPEPTGSSHQVWFRATRDLGDDVAINQVLLAYASDYSLLGTAMRPHGASWMSGVQTASLDHILWFHRPTNFSRWHLYVQDSPSASGARGFNRGAIYREDGVLVASAAQEGLIRRRE